MGTGGGHIRGWAAAALALLTWGGAAARAALGPMDTLVVVNQNDRASRALGDYYMEKHGIPASHRCAVAVPAKAQELSPDAFERDVRVPIEAYLDQSGLKGQIHAVVFCWAGPTRVGYNSLTSAFYYGFKPRNSGGGQCQVADDSRNRYFMAERPYRATAGWSPLRSPLAFVLTARTPEDARAAVDRAVRSTGTRPAKGAFVLASSADNARNVRSRFHAAVGERFARAGMADRIETRAGAPAMTEHPPMGVSLGQPSLPASWKSNGFHMAEGSIGEHLTSCGGQLPEPCFHQSCVWDWLAAGASASYGTVSEPCNFTSKFPHPFYAYYYARGWSAGEALWMSVENPYQGLFAGDPLAAPFAARPTVEIVSPLEGSRVAGPFKLNVRLAGHPDGAPPVYLDLYIDGRHYTPMARPVAAAGNEVEIEIGGETYRYTVQRDDDLYGVAEGVAWAIRNGSGGRVKARADGDSVTVTLNGSEPVSVAARVNAGLATSARMGAKACTGSTVADASGRQGAEIRLWMGSVASYPLSYPLDLSFLEPGAHVLTVVARDGTAVQAQGQASVTLLVGGK
jgi:uncharacterized protein (TIGR03790 family)